jgi:hypothetical protein
MWLAAAVGEDAAVAPVETVVHAVAASGRAPAPAMRSHDGLRRHTEWSFIALPLPLWTVLQTVSTRSKRVLAERHEKFAAF